tara:strand:+ start:2067 stop:2297 length:231 start_codon:yes stop_codon:yes gene_type:complete
MGSVCGSLCGDDSGYDEENFSLGEPTGFQKVAGWDAGSQSVVSDSGKPVDITMQVPITRNSNPPPTSAGEKQPLLG